MIRATNWSSYQSYKDRKPPWIRLHKTLLDNFEFQSMSSNARALLPMLWLLASEDKDPTSGLVTDSLQKISFRLRIDIKDVTGGLREIIDAGFFVTEQPCNEPVTKPLQECIKTVTPETETETETEQDMSSCKSKSDPVPYTKIVNLYHEMLCPPLPKIAKLSEKRKGYIRARWREDMQALNNWENFFDYVRQSDFLMGKAVPVHGRPIFRADIEWLCNPTNFIKIAEDKYHHV